MSVLAHLRDQHAGLTSLASLESIDAVDHPRPAVIVRICAAVDTLYRLGNSVIATESVFHGLTDLTKRRAFAGRVHCQSQQIAGSLGTFAQCVQRSLASSFVSSGLDLLDTNNLRLANLVVVDFQDFDDVLDRKSTRLNSSH